MLSKYVELLKLKFWAPLRLNRYTSYYLSCSQFGEDMIIRHLLSSVTKGFYVDIGAHHPVFFSNTYHFYMKGWKGINVDAIPGSMNLFNLIRPRDINIEACIGDISGKREEFYMFDVPALNTLSKKEADRIIQTNKANLLRKIELSTISINDLLASYLPAGQGIDFLTVDLEGIDKIVLNKLDLERFSPKVIVYEYNSNDLKSHMSLDRLTYLSGYSFAAMTGTSIIIKKSIY